MIETEVTTISIDTSEYEVDTLQQYVAERILEIISGDGNYGGGNTN